MRRRILVPLVAGTLALGAPAGVAQASTPAVYQIRTHVSVTLSDAGGVYSPVEATTLQAGSWTISSNLTAINFGPGDFVRCQLRSDGALIDGGATVYLADRVAGLVDIGTVVSTTSITVETVCDHDSSASSSGQFYVDPGATLTAVKGGPISAPGIPHSGQPTVVEARSATSKALVTHDLQTVTSVHLGQGTWALTGNGSGVDFAGNSDAAVCTFFAPGESAGSFGFIQVFVGNPDSLVANLAVDGTVTEPASGGTVDFVCEAGYNDNTVTVDQGATLTATRVTASTVQAGAVGTVALPDAGGTTKPVVTRHMAAGAWRIRSGIPVGNHDANNGWGGGRDFLRCTLRANGVSIDGGATVEMTDQTAFEEIVNAGTYTATAPWTLTLACSHDAAHTGDGHWSTLSGGEVLAIDRGPIN